jgi:hypothetical protein
VSNKDSIDEDDDHHPGSPHRGRGGDSSYTYPQVTQLMKKGLFNDDDQRFVHLAHMLNTQLALRD